jgi:hypothetical protein
MQQRLQHLEKNSNNNVKEIRPEMITNKPDAYSRMMISLELLQQW